MKKVTDLEKVLEEEREKVLKLNEECSSLKRDALLAREEFEKEYNDRNQLEQLFSAHETDYGMLL